MKEKSQDLTGYFNENIRIGLKQIMAFSIQNPALLLKAGRLYLAFRRASKKRAEYIEQSIQIPPMIIFSVTNACNLDCAGCYAKLLHNSNETELNAGQFKQLLHDAQDLGVSIFLLAGGEPLMRDGLLKTLKEFPKMIFLLFTNGTLLDDTAIQSLKKQRNILTIISLEGDQHDTDLRRGGGVFERAHEVFAKLKCKKILFGTSITQTSQNFDLVNDEEYLVHMMEKGCQVFFFINYLPVNPQTNHLALDRQQVEQHLEILKKLRAKYPALFLAFPGGEVEIGGCLAGGKGLIHINPLGDVQPCPFSPFSDANLKEVSLLDALRSSHLETIRNSGDRLDESDGSCALWKNKAWVEDLYKK